MSFELEILNIPLLDQSLYFPHPLHAAITIAGQSFQTAIPHGTRERQSFSVNASDDDILDVSISDANKVVIGYLKSRIAVLNEEPIQTPAGRPMNIILRVKRVPTLRLFALIIGINEYSTQPALDGCVHDAEMIRAYLMDTFHTPPSRMVFLANERATRDAIMRHFETHLINNGEIQWNDAILIYFAGHGSRSPAPGTWPSPEQKVESIVPYDEGTCDNLGRYVHGIPDRTINAQLRMLAASKGTNITVIFDCCHSAGLSRDISRLPRYKVRAAVPKAPIPDNLDSDIWGRDGQYPSSYRSRGFRNMDMSTHVILAACKASEVARESLAMDGSSCGAFTDGLLMQLRKYRGALDQVTYHDLVTPLQLPNQHPECIGIKKHCALFHLSAAHTPSKRYQLRSSRQGAGMVDIGSADGVKVGTVFAVYGDAEIPASGIHLGILVAISIQANSSVLHRRPGDNSFRIPPQATVTVIDWNNDARSLKIFVDPEHEDTLMRMSHPLHHNANPIHEFHYTRVSQPDHADVMVGQEVDGRICVKRLCQAIGARANQVVRFDAPPDLHYLFDAIARFKYCVEQEHIMPTHGENIAANVSLELRRVASDWPFDLDPSFPTDLFTNGKAILKDDPDAKYGLTIKNDSRHKLFFYVFALNSTNYSIENLYMPNPPEHGLPGKDIVKLGYGEPDSEPFSLFVDPGEQSEIIFIKMYISNKPMDLTWMVQQFPFHSTGTRGILKNSFTAFHSREYVVKIVRDEADCPE